MIEFSPWRDGDFVEVASFSHAQDRVFGYFFAEADASRANDASFGIVDDGRTEGDGLGFVDQFIGHALGGAHMVEPIILQFAFTGLVTYGAIDGVIEQQEFLDGVSRAFDVFAGVAEHFHIFGDGHLARGLQFGFSCIDVLPGGSVEFEDIQEHGWSAGRWKDFHQAHSAVSGDTQSWVPAVIRDIDTRAIGGTHDGVTSFERDVFAIDLEGRHA